MCLLKFIAPKYVKLEIKKNKSIKKKKNYINLRDTGECHLIRARRIISCIVSWASFLYEILMLRIECYSFFLIN